LTGGSAATFNGGALPSAFCGGGLVSAFTGLGGLVSAFTGLGAWELVSVSNGRLTTATKFVSGYCAVSNTIEAESFRLFSDDLFPSVL
jgi:hypothetical protein